MTLTDRLLSIVGLGPLTRAVAPLPSTALTVIPPAPGIAVGRVASKASAAADLELLKLSPTLYAGMLARALAVATYPVIVKAGARVLPGSGQNSWVRDFRNLLTTPTPPEPGDIFPRTTGVSLFAQILTDLVMTGDAFVVPTLAEGSARPVALTRCHPRTMTLVRMTDGDAWEYRSGFGTVIRFPAGMVAHLRLISADQGSLSELGTGAAASLSALVVAERAAVEKTAATIRQGGVDIVVRPASPTGAAMLMDEAIRKTVLDTITQGLEGGIDGSRRVMILGGDFLVEPAGFTPAEIQAPEFVQASRDQTLAAIQVVPVMVGGGDVNFATAAIQLRVQYEADRSLAKLIADQLLTPLARAFAGSYRAGSGSDITAELDLSDHPGAIAMRTEAINRMTALVAMGWSPEQAAAAEGVDLPKPDAPAPAPAAPVSGPASAPPAAPASGDAPTPVGDAAARQNGLSWLQRDATTPAPEVREVAKFTASMLRAFRVGLEWNDAGFAGDGLKPETVRRASWAVETGGPPSDAWVVEASAWHRRHHPNGVSKIDGRKKDPSPLDVATALWGILSAEDAAWWDRQREAIGGDRAAAAEQAVAATEAAAASVRASSWAHVDASRAPRQRRIESAARATQARELAAYQRRILAALPASVTGERQRLVTYGSVDWGEVLGAISDARALWTDGLSPSWLASWEEAAAGALPGFDLIVPMPTATKQTLADLEAGAAAVADYSRERVRLHVEAGIRDGLSVVDIAESLRTDQAFAPFRALRIARTETVRSDTAGSQARAAEAARVGVEVEQEWMSDPQAALWDRRHDRLDGQTRPIGGTWRTPMGVDTTGPGMSGDPGEDCNCVCASSLRVVQR